MCQKSWNALPFVIFIAYVSSLRSWMHMAILSSREPVTTNARSSSRESCVETKSRFRIENALHGATFSYKVRHTLDTPVASCSPTRCVLATHAGRREWCFPRNVQHRTKLARPLKWLLNPLCSSSDNSAERHECLQDRVPVGMGLIIFRLSPVLLETKRLWRMMFKQTCTLYLRPKLAAFLRKVCSNEWTLVAYRQSLHEPRLLILEGSFHEASCKMTQEFEERSRSLRSCGNLFPAK